LRNFERLGTSPAGMGLLLAATGLIVWVSLSIWGGFASPDGGFHLREAWDIAAYFYLGVPVMALAVGAASFVRPRRVWRWPLWLVGGHQLGLLLVGLGMQSGFSLILLTLMLAVLLVAFFTIPAMLGSIAARRLVERIQ
jgi:hypothetical protein